jgi:putative flavoprotein involved in K+ transport
MTTEIDLTPTPGGFYDDALDVLVIGAGQAGLATAYHQRLAGFRFLVVDAGSEIGGSWRSRWDTLRLFTPAQYDALPGLPFPAPADTYPTKDQVADYLQDYAAHFDLPVLLGCAVQRVVRIGDRFSVHTSQGLLRARRVVVATGPFQKPAVPAIGASLGSDVVQLHSSSYRNPSQVPDGRVVVVGAGNSGRQIAVELSETHDVTLAVGTAPLELPQRPLGRDLFWWLTRLGATSKTESSLLARRMRARGDIVIGTPMQDLRAAGIDVRPRLMAASAETLRFQDRSTVSPTAVVWATGFRSHYSWIEIPRVVVDGKVAHRRGVTEIPGLYFIGLPWQHTRGSALLGFVKDDSEWLVDQMSHERAQPVAG